MVHSLLEHPRGFRLHGARPLMLIMIPKRQSDSECPHISGPVMFGGCEAFRLGRAVFWGVGGEHTNGRDHPFWTKKMLREHLAQLFDRLRMVASGRREYHLYPIAVAVKYAEPSFTSLSRSRPLYLSRSGLVSRQMVSMLIVYSL